MDVNFDRNHLQLMISVDIYAFSLHYGTLISVLITFLLDITHFNINNFNEFHGLVKIVILIGLKVRNKVV